MLKSIFLNDKVVLNASKLSHNPVKGHLTLTYPDNECLNLLDIIDPKVWSIDYLSKKKVRLYPIIDNKLTIKGKTFEIFYNTDSCVVIHKDEFELFDSFTIIPGDLSWMTN